MELGRASGFAVVAAALVAMPDGMPSAIAVERFDIRTGLEDRRLIALEDLLISFEGALFAWLIADGDMRMKNLALLQIADSGAAQFREVRMAALYDAVTTRVFPRPLSDVDRRRPLTG